MSSRTAVLWVLAFLVLAVVGGGGLELFEDDGGDSLTESGALPTRGRVVRVVDGDTIRVRLGDRTTTVRYIGVDTPESVIPGQPVECFGKRATELNRRLVAGKRVRLRYGPERRDRYGRLLAYVYPSGSRRSVSATLVARGRGTVLVIPPNSAHAERYRALERRARERRLGLWSACPRG